MISCFLIKRRKNYRGNYFNEVDCKYPLHIQRTGGKDKNEVNEKGGMSVCKSYADFTGKLSSDNDIQLMVYSVRN